METVISVISVASPEPVVFTSARVGQKLLADTADTADMADSKKPGKNAGAHVCQKRLAELAGTAHLAEMAEMAKGKTADERRFRRSFHLRQSAFICGSNLFP